MRDHSDPLQMPEKQFQSVYRLSRAMVNDLIVALAPHLPEGQRETFIPPKLKVHIFIYSNYLFEC